MLISVNGADLYYHLEGAGIPCFVPVLVGTPLYERTLSRELRRRFQFVFVELRGSGRSGGDSGTVTLAQQVDDLEQLRRALGFERIALLGHSAPGFYCLEYAAWYPERASHVILIGTPPRTNLREEVERYREEFASEERHALWRENRARVTDEVLADATPSEAWRRRTLAGAPWAWYDPRFDATDLIAGSVVSFSMLGRFFGELLPHYDVAERFPRVACPVFVATGRYDFLVPPHTWDTEREKFGDCTVRVFERSGHYPQYEEQAAFDAALLSWLDRQEA